MKNYLIQQNCVFSSYALNKNILTSKKFSIQEKHTISERMKICKYFSTSHNEFNDTTNNNKFICYFVNILESLHVCVVVIAFGYLMINFFKSVIALYIAKYDFSLDLGDNFNKNLIKGIIEGFAETVQTNPKFNNDFITIFEQLFQQNIEVFKSELFSILKLELNNSAEKLLEHYKTVGIIDVENECKKIFNNSFHKAFIKIYQKASIQSFNNTKILTIPDENILAKLDQNNFMESFQAEVDKLIEQNPYNFPRVYQLTFIKLYEQQIKKTINL
jgi:hypothetical protein